MTGWIVYGIGVVVCWQVALAHGSDPEDDWWSYLLWPLWLSISLLLVLGWVVAQLVRLLTSKPPVQ